VGIMATASVFAAAAMPRCSLQARVAATIPLKPRISAAQVRAAPRTATRASASKVDVKPEADVEGMTAWLDSLKYNSDGLVAAIVQVTAKPPSVGALCASGGPPWSRSDVPPASSLPLPPMGRCVTQPSSKRRDRPNAGTEAPSGGPWGAPSPGGQGTGAPPTAALPHGPAPQHVDTGEVMMQAFCDRAAVSETLQTGLATFYSRSRKGRWCKGETSGNFIKVLSLHVDCDKDSIVMLSDPVGPACHTGARTCWFQEAGISGDGGVVAAGEHSHATHTPRTTLLQLEATIAERRRQAEDAETKPSWTAKLINDPALCCKKIREEAGELCETWEKGEGPERAASEMADLLYHSMVLLNVHGVPVEDVLRELRGRFGVSGIDEKASRAPKE